MSVGKLHKQRQHGPALRGRTPHLAPITSARPPSTSEQQASWPPKRAAPRHRGKARWVTTYGVRLCPNTCAQQAQGSQHLAIGRSKWPKRQTATGRPRAQSLQHPTGGNCAAGPYDDRAHTRMCEPEKADRSWTISQVRGAPPAVRAQPGNTRTIPSNRRSAPNKVKSSHHKEHILTRMGGQPPDERTSGP